MRVGDFRGREGGEAGKGGEEGVRVVAGGEEEMGVGFC